MVEVGGSSPLASTKKEKPSYGGFSFLVVYKTALCQKRRAARFIRLAIFVSFCREHIIQCRKKDYVYEVAYGNDYVRE